MKTRFQFLVLALALTAAGRALAAPSEEFQAFVQSIRIDGVFNGTPQKIYVNKTVYRVGAVLNAALGVKLVAVDFVGKVVIFEDKAGERLMKEFGGPK